MEINKTTIGIAAGVAGTLFLGYCIYFDKKRRNDPDYKRKVRERRRRQRKTGSATKNELPDLSDHEAIEKYFMREIQLGEVLIASGEYELGVEHLSNAIVVCGEPTNLLEVLQTTLHPQVFRLLIQKVQQLNRSDTVKKAPKIVAASTSSEPTSVSVGGVGIEEIDDLE